MFGGSYLCIFNLILYNIFHVCRLSRNSILIEDISTLCPLPNALKNIEML